MTESQCNKATMKNWVDLTRQPKRLLRPDYDILHWAIEGGGKPLSYALEVKHQGTKLLTCHFDLPLQWPLNSLMSIKERYTKSELVQCHESSFHSTSRTRTTQTTRSLIRSTIWSIEPGYCFRIPNDFDRFPDLRVPDRPSTFIYFIYFALILSVVVGHCTLIYNP
jgi:hypothetical protein